MMDKKTYLELKKNKEELPVYKRESTCFVCFKLRSHCLCSLIKPFQSETHFVLLMHPMEAKKERMGTGRICKAGLANSKLIVGIDFTENNEVNDLIHDKNNYCMAMYPGEKAINISEHDVKPLLDLKDAQRKLVVFLIDGTWSCAKKMMTLSKNIQALPRLSFTAKHESLFAIKQQPAEYCLSTLESIHFYLSEAIRRGVETHLTHQHDNLLDVFKYMIDFQIKCAVDPNLSHYRKKEGGFTAKELRPKSKKWQKRKIVLSD